MKFLLHMILVIVILACTGVTVFMLAYPMLTFREGLHWYAAIYVLMLGSWMAAVAMRDARE